MEEIVQVEKLALGEVVNITETSWRLKVEQTPPVDGAAFEDRYYLTSDYIDVEPVEMPFRGVSDPAYDHVDYAGMPNGKQYFVKAWRRYTDDPDRPHLPCVNSSTTTCMTKEDVVTIDPSYRTHRFDLTTLDDFAQAWCNRQMHARCMHDDEMGDFIRMDLTGDECPSCVMTSRKRFNKDKPIVVRGRVRNTRGPWGALILYNGEAEDMGISWNVRNRDIRYTVNLPWSPGNVGSIMDRTADFEFMYDKGKVAYWITFPGEEKRLLGTRDYTLNTDPPLWIGGTQEGSQGWIDYSNLEVIGEETYGSSEGGPNFWKFENSGCAGGTEWQNGYPQDGSEHFYAQAGFWSIRRNPKGDAPVTVYDGLTLGVSRDQYSYPAGEARMTTAKVQPSAGYGYDSLRLIGSTRSGGELKVYVKDAEGRVISGLPQTGGIRGADEATGDEWFCPVYGITQEVDLGGVSVKPIYFEAYVMNPNDGVTDQNMWSPPGLNKNDGTDTGPPCLKSLIVDFK